MFKDLLVVVDDTVKVNNKCIGENVLLARLNNLLFSIKPFNYGKLIFYSSNLCTYLFFYDKFINCCYISNYAKVTVYIKLNSVKQFYFLLMI